MKKLIFMMLLIVATLTNCQELNYNSWKIEEEVDEFGDPNGFTHRILYGDGTFSNSDSRDNNLTVKVFDHGSTFDFIFYEYDIKTGVGIGSEGGPGFISIKTDKGVKNVFCYSTSINGIQIAGEYYTGIYFAGENSANELKTIFTENKGKTIKIRLSEDNFGGGDSEYVFSLNL